MIEKGDVTIRAKNFLNVKVYNARCHLSAPFLRPHDIEEKSWDLKPEDLGPTGLVEESG